METGYYRLIKPFNDDDPNDQWEVGQLWYFVGLHGDDQAHLLQGENGWYVDLSGFIDCFEFAPDGLAERQARMGELMTGLHDIGSRSDVLLETQKVQPAITFQDPDEIEGEIISSESVDLDESPKEEKFGALSVQMTDQVSKQTHGIKIVKTKLATIRRQIARRNKELQLMIKEQAMILREKTSLLESQMELASEAIYILNAYLGKDEELVRIKNGKRASADEKIVIRQLILYMDEESAAADKWAEKGGMDFQDVKEFDKWVIKPKNLAIICPDKKGIVAIKPRRSDKFYSDNPLENAELNRANKCLYILVRNGNLIYRIHTSLWLEDVFFPRKDEFEEYFYYSGWSNGRDPQPLRPGSAQYMEAMKKADKHRRRFFAALLLIQGILDRTKVLQPLPVDRLNIVDVHEAAKYCTFLQNAENLLGDGRPKFKEWLSEINGKMHVGSRIIGNFGWGDKFSARGSYRDTDDRKWPSRANDPSTYSIYVLEKKDKDDFKFFYSRDGDIVYSGWNDWGHKPVNRASYKVNPQDTFILCFDEATVADMEYYMNSRTDRHGYESMLPLMNIACEMKRREAEEESPFRQLLTGEIMKAHNVSCDIVEDRIDTLIGWFKFKNKTHRALNSDDAKALRMIVKEFGNRWKLEKQKIELADEHRMVVESLKKEDNLVVFHRRNNEYVLFRFMNEENIFICEEHWIKDDEIKCVKKKEWVTVDARYHSWNILWQHERWEEWELNPKPSVCMTDPERLEAVEYGLKIIKKRDLEALFGWFHHRSKDDAKYWLVPLAAVVTESSKIYIYFLETHAKFEKKSLRGRNEKPNIGRLEVVAVKKPGKDVKYRIGKVCTVSVHLTGDGAPWTEEYKKGDFFSRSLDTGRSFKRCLKLFPENIESGVAEVNKVKEANSVVREMRRPADRIEQQVYETIKELWWEEQHAKFDEEYEDPDGDLWEDHKEDMKGPKNYDLFPHWVESITYPLIESGVDMDGMTLEEGAKIAKFKPSEDQIYYDRVKHLVMNPLYGAEDETEEEDDWDDD